MCSAQCVGMCCMHIIILTIIAVIIIIIMMTVTWWGLKLEVLLPQPPNG